MDCNEAAEFVSALYDGEAVTRAAAEHLGTCEACQARLKSYMEIGVELRRLAILEIPEAIPQRLWDKPQWSLKLWWQRGWEMMRIPRVAFVVMSVGIVVLASSLAVVGVRAHSEGTVVMLRITPESGHSSVPCPLSTTDKKDNICGGVNVLKTGMLTYQVKLLQRDGSRVQLGVRTKLDPSTFSGSYSLSALDSLPEKQYWFEPGGNLQVELPDSGKMIVTGEWMDHMPAFMGEDQDVDPGPGQLRIKSPLLLRNNRVLGDLEGGGMVAEGQGRGVEIFMPSAGRFRFSTSPLQGAITGKVKLNRITFESQGQSYLLITSTPITRAETVWILHDANYKPSGYYPNSSYIGGSDLTDLISEEPTAK